MSDAVIYLIENTANKRQYVGVTGYYEGRSAGHISLLRNGKHPIIAMQEDFNQHGASAFAFSQICDVREDKYGEEQEEISRRIASGLSLYNGSPGRKSTPRTTMSNEDEKLIRVKLDTHKKLKVLSAINGVTLDEIINRAIDTMAKVSA